MDFTARRKKTISRLQNESSCNDFFLFWYSGTGTYSQVFSYNATALQSIPAELKAKMKKGQEVKIENGAKREKALLLARGTMAKLVRASKVLDMALEDLEFIDTDTVMRINLDSTENLATQVETSSSSESSDSSEILSSALGPVAKKSCQQLPGLASSSAPIREAAKLNALRDAQASNSVAETPRVSLAGSAAAISSARTPIQSDLNEKILDVMKQQLKEQKRTNRLLAAILEKQDVTTNHVTMENVSEFICHNQQVIDLAQIPCHDPNSFARKFITIVHGKEALKGRLLSSKRATKRALFSPVEYEDVFKAVNARFPKCSWPSVESSVNQYLRDICSSKKE